ncbi:MAG: ABC transporter permease, partial [Candidatus Omnitrophica bacterium]|nr:ABC transporter permease [Candidatus Omnitrophota bacterium]
IIGVAAVIYMLAVIEGRAQRTQERIRARGATNIMVRAKKPVEDPNGSNQRMGTYGLTYEDAARIKETFDQAEVITPVREVNNKISWTTNQVDAVAFGTVPWFPEVARVQLERGIWFHELHMKPPKAVCVLGAALVQKLFEYRDPLGRTIRIGGSRFRVIGVLEPITNIDGPDAQKMDNGAFIPLTAVLQHFGDRNIKQGQGSLDIEKVELHQILVRARTLDSVLGVADGIRAMLEQFHKKVDYEIEAPLALLKEARAAAAQDRIQYGAIAAISLLVGAIGIMNIMLASVTERTREIGIRRAIGARKRQIVSQFLIETVVLSTIGGFIGIAIGLAIPWSITFFAGMPTVVTPFSLVLSLGISMGVGMLFGIYPAMRAAALDPIVALRHE